MLRFRLLLTPKNRIYGISENDALLARTAVLLVVGSALSLVAVGIRVTWLLTVI